MRFIDRAFGVTLLAFVLGSLAGALLTGISPPLRAFMTLLLNSRTIEPLRAAAALSETTVALLVFANNCLPVALSFLYPLVIIKVRWIPPLKKNVRNRLLGAFSLLTGALLGFFDLGASLMLVSELGGISMLNRLLAISWLHAPLEFLLVLVCVAEPLRIVESRTGKEITRLLRADLMLLFVSMIGLLGSAAIEVFLRL